MKRKLFSLALTFGMLCMLTLPACAAEKYGMPAPALEAAAEPRILVAFFSATGTTRTLAEYAGEALHADLYEIVPEIPYTADDLNYGNSSSRTTREQNDPSARPAIAGRTDCMADYDVVFLGYPKMEYGFNCVSCI